MNRTPPTRAQLILQLKNLTKQLEDHGAQAERMAPLLAARGWPTRTSGAAPGSTGTSPPVPDDEAGVTLTSTEAAASHRNRWADADEKLARLYLQTYVLVSAGQQLIADLTAHATTDADHEGHDLAHTGTNGGWCLACDRWVTGATNDRLRSGFCDACRKAWNRLAADEPFADRATFIRNRTKTDARTRAQRIDPTEPTTTALHLDVDRATSATHEPAGATRWHHGQTTDLTDPAA